MSGLLRRLTRRRPATADENRSSTAGSSEPAAAAADAPAEPGGDRPVPAADEQQTQVLPATGEQPAVGEPSPGAAWAKSAATTAQPDQRTAAQPAQPIAEPGDQPTAFAAQPAPVRDLPAGVDAGDLTSAPLASARRGKLRRRLRYLRHVRELLLRDLGGFTYEVHRTAGGTPQETHRRLSDAKANRISAIDAEVGALEAQLGVAHVETVLREAGIGGTCPECGELHASDAHFCSRCGTPLDAKARAQRQAAIAAAASAPTTGSHPTAEPQPASVLWAGGPRPSAKPEPEEAEPPAAVTSEWLRGRDQPTTFDRAAQPDEPAKSDEPAAADEPAPTKAADEATKADEAKADEPVAADEAAKAEEAKADEPAATNAADEAAKADEPVAAAEEPAAPAKPKRRPRKAAPKPAPEPEAAEEPGKFEPGPNGRGDEDVAPPITSGDPLASRREQTP